MKNHDASGALDRMLGGLMHILLSHTVDQNLVDSAPDTLLRRDVLQASSNDGDGFRLSVLKPDAPRYKLDALFGALTPRPNRDTDNFALGDADREDAAIRQAYRDEAKRAGAAAPTL